MFIKVLALSAILASAYGGGHTHIAHSIEIKHEEPKKVDHHHNTHKTSYHGAGTGISVEGGLGLGSLNSYKNEHHGDQQSLGLSNNGYEKYSLGSQSESRGEGSYNNEDHQSHGHAYSSQSLLKHEVKHDHKKQETEFSGYHYEAPKLKLESSYSGSLSGLRNDNSNGNGKDYTSSYHLGQDNSNRDSHGHAYSSQSIIHHKTEHGHYDQSLSQGEKKGQYSYNHKSSNNLGSSQGNSDYSGYKTSYESSLGLGHYGISLQDSTTQNEESYQHNSISKGKVSVGHSHGHSVSIHHGDNYGKHQEESSLLSSNSLNGYNGNSDKSSAYHQSGKSDGHSISIHHGTGDRQEYKSQSSSIGSSQIEDSGSHYENQLSSSSIKHNEEIGNENHHSHTQTGKSHGHSISIVHETGHKQKNHGHQSNSYFSNGESSFAGHKDISSSGASSVSQISGYNSNAQSLLGESHTYESGHELGSYHTGLSSSGNQGSLSVGGSSISENSDYDSKSKSSQSHGHSISIKHEIGHGYQGHSSSSRHQDDSSIGSHYSTYQGATASGKSQGDSVAIHHEDGHKYSLGGSSESSLSSGYETGLSDLDDHDSSSNFNSKTAKSHGHSISIHHDTSHKSGSSSGSFLTSNSGYDSLSQQDASSNHLSHSGKTHGHSVSVHHEKSLGSGYGGYESKSSISGHATSSQNQKLHHNHEGYHYESPSVSGLNSGSFLGGLSLGSGSSQGESGYYHKESSLGASDSSSSSLSLGNHGQEENYKYSQDSLGGLSGYGEEHHYEEHHTLPKYEFHYTVKDKHTGDVKSQHELRDGHSVKGEYSLRQPDGSLRVVEYHADKHTGFKAQVQHETHHHH